MLKYMALASFWLAYACNLLVHIHLVHTTIIYFWMKFGLIMFLFNMVIDQGSTRQTVQREISYDEYWVSSLI